MPVQIPVVERNQNVPEDASVGRISQPAVDAVDSVTQNTQAVVGLGDEAVKIADQSEENANKTLALDKANELDQFGKKKLYGDSENGIVGIVHQEGDPTKLYNDFDKDLNDKMQELSGGDDSSLSPKAQNAIKRALAEKYNQIYDTRLVAFGSQSARYDENVAQSTIGLEKNNMLTAAGLVKPGDPTSFGPMDASIEKIRQTVLGQGIKDGSVTVDPTGKGTQYIDSQGNSVAVNVGVTAKIQIQKTLSDGLYNSIDNVLKSNEPDLAKAMMDKYGLYLDPLHTKALTEEFTKVDMTTKAYSAVAKTQGMSATDQIAAVNKMFPSEKDAEVKSKALEFIDSQQRHLDDMKERQSKDNSNQLLNYVDAKQRSPEPFTSTTELEGDSLFKRLIGNVSDAKQRAAIYHLVEQPKDSDEEAKTRYFNSIADGSIYTMQPVNFASLKSGLNKQDAHDADLFYQHVLSDTDSQQKSRQSNLLQGIRERAIGSGYVTVVNGQMSSNDAQKLNNLYSSATQYSAVPKGTSTQEVAQQADKIISDAIVQDHKSQSPAFWSGVKNYTGFDFSFGRNKKGPIPLNQTAPFPTKQKSDTTPQASTVPQTSSLAPSTQISSLKGLNSAQVSQYSVNYQQKFGVAPTAADLIDFINGKKK